MKFKPLHNWVLLRRSAPEEMTSGGIIIPDAARSRPVEGLVEAIGPGRFTQEKGKKEKKFVPTVLKPGQQVMFVEYMAKDITLDGIEVTVIREDDILGIIDSSGALAIKEHYHIEVKKNHPPMVQAKISKAVARRSSETDAPLKTVQRSEKTGEKAKTKGDTKPKQAKPAKNAAPKKTLKKTAAKKK